MKPLLVVGSANADVVIHVQRLPHPGETIAGSAAAVFSGGKGANQAAAASRLGARVHFAGFVGSDAFAEPLRRDLALAGVELSLLGTAEGPTGQAMILIQRGGENSIVLVAGANHRWPVELPATLMHVLSGCAAVLLQREIPERVNLQVAQAARAVGVAVVFDAGGAEGPLPAELLAVIDVLSPNESELARLTSMPTDDESQVVAAAHALLHRGVGMVLVKLGARGSLLVGAGGLSLSQQAYRVPVVDTTGAGDCFTAAFAVGLAQDLSLPQRLRLASAAAALCVQAKGAMPSMPGRPAVERFLALHADTNHG